MATKTVVYCKSEDGKKYSQKGIRYFICRTCGRPVGDYRLKVCPKGR